MLAVTHTMLRVVGGAATGHSSRQNASCMRRCNATIMLCASLNQLLGNGAKLERPETKKVESLHARGLSKRGRQPIDPHPALNQQQPLLVAQLTHAYLEFDSCCDMMHVLVLAVLVCTLALMLSRVKPCLASNMLLTNGLSSKARLTPFNKQSLHTHEVSTWWWE